MLPNYFISSLAQTLNVGGNDTQIELSTIYTLDGQIITTADFAQFGRGILTIDPIALAFTEFASFTAVDPALGDSGGVTGVLRGLSFKSNSQIPANQKFHPVGTPVLISWGTHNIEDVMTVIQDNYDTLYNLIQSAIIAGALPASKTVTGITRLTVNPSVTLGNPTITLANPAVITLSNHGLTAGDTVVFTTSGTLPASIVSGSTYYVISAGLTANTFEISSTFNGSAISTNGQSQSGTHTVAVTTPYAVSRQDYRLNPNNYNTGSGTNTYVLTLDNAPTAYEDGQEFLYKIPNTNTGASTLNVNGLGAIPIVKGISSPLSGGELIEDAIVCFVYDGGNFLIESNSAASTVINRFTVNADETGKDWYANITRILGNQTTTPDAFGWTGNNAGTFSISSKVVQADGIYLPVATTGPAIAAYITSAPIETSTEFRIRFEFQQLSSDGREDLEIGFDTNFIYVPIGGASVQAVSEVGGTTTTTLGSIVPTDKHIYEIVFSDSLGEVQFWVDGALLATHTTNIGTSVDTLKLQQRLVYDSGSGGTAIFFISSWTFAGKL